MPFEGWREEWADLREPFGAQKGQSGQEIPYVVALARAVNALNSAHSLMMSTNNRNTPEAMRDRMNGHFFVSGILYETLKLIRSMSSIFYGRTEL